MPAMSVKCPTCARQVEWSEVSPFRPFCSERCKLIDFGAWATQKHSIPGEAAEPAAGAGADDPEKGARSERD